MIILQAWLTYKGANAVNHENKMVYDCRFALADLDASKPAKNRIRQNIFLAYSQH